MAKDFELKYVGMVAAIIGIVVALIGFIGKIGRASCRERV